MITIQLFKPSEPRPCQGLSCCAPAIVDVVAVLKPDQWKVESFCRAHLLEWAADVETFEFPTVKRVEVVRAP